MASDLKLEIFASQLFQTFWKKQKFFSETFEASFMYRDEYHLVSQNEKLYKESYFKAVFIRCQLFRQVFQKEISENFFLLESSAMCISDYISTTCERNDLFGNLTIFERLFSTCAFVVHLSIFCYKIKGRRDITGYAHLCWAMYFEKYSEEFYKLGGWNQLSIVSVSYVLPYELLSFCTYLIVKDAYSLILKMTEAMDSYKNFLLFADLDYTTISKAWVIFHLQKLNRFDVCDGIKNKKSEQNIRDSNEVEKILTHLKRFCDPCGLEALKEIANIKMPITVIHSENSKVPHPVENNRNIFIRENNSSQIIYTEEHPINNEKSCACSLETSKSRSLENNAYNLSENELLVIPRGCKIQQHMTTVDDNESVLECLCKNSQVQPETFTSLFEQNTSFENTNSEGSFLEASGLYVFSKSAINTEHQDTNLEKFGKFERTISKAENLQDRDSVRHSIPNFSSKILIQNSKICKHCTETVLETQLKQANSTLNDMTDDTISNTKINPAEIYLKENYDKTNAVPAKDLSRNTESITNANSNDTSQNSSYLIPQKSFNDDFFENKTHSANGHNINEQIRKETDLERESIEVKCLLRLILVLGNQQGIAHVRSSMGCSDKHQHKKFLKK